MNGIFRGKNLGTISTLNEYVAFRQEHGIDTKEYKDIFLGDYFIVQDGTYNETWMVADFDYYNNLGEKNASPMEKGIVLIPKTMIFTNGVIMHAKVNDQDTTEGGYKSTVVHNTHCVAVGSALQIIFGSYLKPINAMITNNVSTTINPASGLGWYGSSISREWSSTLCILPTEHQMYGTGVFSSSGIEPAEAVRKLAVFNFINHNYYERWSTWLRNVASNTAFAVASWQGSASYATASTQYSLRPLVYIS